MEYFKHRGGDKRSGHFDQLRYNKHVKPVLGDRLVKDIAPLDMERIKKNMSDLAPATIWGALELVRRISNFGARTGMCDPLKFKVQLPKLDNQKVEYLEPEQLQRLLEVLEVWPFREPARMIYLPSSPECADARFFASRIGTLTSGKVSSPYAHPRAARPSPSL
ncbi:MAG: hypothetical protein U5L00_07185 [Desulfovermiculus sp.]|nr:hypothetical protein [Desulfovermiculus sp.]